MRDDWADILVALHGAGARFLVVGAHALANRREAVVSGVSVPFLGRADLMANKRATGRLRDLADLEALEQATPRSEP